MIKLNSLEDKIKDKIDKFEKKYFNTIHDDYNEELAHDIVEICEKEKETLDHEALMSIIKKSNKLNWKLDKLEKENEDLKLQLETTKSWHSGEVGLNDKLMKENASLQQQILNLSDENTKLGHDYKMFKDLYDDIKQQTSNIKYLSYKEVEKIIIMSNTIKEAINKVCNLAIQPITKDKIINAIARHCIDLGIISGEPGILEQIAAEILSSQQDKIL